MPNQSIAEPVVTSLEEMKSLFRQLKAKSKDLPPGEYLAKLKSLTSHPAASSSFLLRFVVVSPEEQFGKEAFRRLWITENGLPTTIKDLAKIGIYDVDEIKEEIELDLLCKIIVNESTSDSSVFAFEICDA